MKRLFVFAAITAMMATVGCDQNSTPGGPGAAVTSAKRPTIGQADETFTLSTPTLSTSVKQGEAKNVTISINRGTNFDSDVALKFDGTPKGVTIDPAAPTIKHGETEAKLTIKAADDAALGDFTIKVMGHPTKGTDAAKDLKITVNKK